MSEEKEKEKEKTGKKEKRDRRKRDEERGGTTFEEALAEVEKHVGKLETGELGLDEAVATYEKGLAALRLCQKILAEAEKRIEVLTGFDEEGRPVTEPFDRAEATRAGVDHLDGED